VTLDPFDSSNFAPSTMSLLPRDNMESFHTGTFETHGSNAAADMEFQTSVYNFSYPSLEQNAPGQVVTDFYAPLSSDVVSDPSMPAWVTTLPTGPDTDAALPFYQSG
jgi:hypothetical protein